MFGMRRLAIALIAATLPACLASAASAAYKYPPGPPFRTCPDSVTIYQAQMSDTTINACYPAIADTIAGMRGIITAFRYRSTGRVYIEDPSGAPYKGIQVYTVGHPETQGLALGDEVSVSGLQQAYQGESQIQGTLGTTLTVRKISSGNPLPPYKVGTTTDFKWTPAAGAGSSYATANPHEGCLVRINGPLKVARVAAGNGLYAGTNWLLVNADGSAAGDSVLVDGYTLTAFNVLAPPLGYAVNSVQGILRRAINNGVDCWLITLRDASDPIPVAPNLSEAFPVAENKLRLIFDRNLDVTTAQNIANYSLGSELSGSTVDAATVVGGSGSVVELTITELTPHGAAESIQTQNIGSLACPGCLSPAQSLNFILGVLTPAEVQAPLADSLAGIPCLDKSAYAGSGSAYGPRMTVRGVFVQSYGTLYYIEGAAGGLRNGISIFNPNAALQQGHEYLIACRAQEFYTETELTNTAYIEDLGAVTVPAPIVQTLAVLNDGSCDPTGLALNAEDCEGVLVRMEKVKVVPFNTDPRLPSPGGSFRVTPWPTVTSDTLLVSNLGDRYTFAADTGMVLNVTGVLHVDADVSRILPRDGSDIVTVLDDRVAIEKRQKAEVKVQLGKLCLKWNGDEGTEGRHKGEIYLTVSIHWPTRVEHPESLEVLGPVNGTRKFDTSTLVETPPGSGTYAIQPACHNVDDANGFIYSNQADCPVATNLLVDIYVWEQDGNNNLADYKKLLDAGKAKALKNAADGGVKATLADLVAKGLEELIGSFTDSGDHGMGRFTDFVPIPDPCTNCLKVVKTLDLENRVPQSLWNDAEDSHDWRFKDKGFPTPPPIIGTIDLVVFVCPKTEMFSSHATQQVVDYRQVEEIDLGQSDECTITTALGLGSTIPSDNTANASYSAYLDADDDPRTGAVAYPATGAEYQLRLTIDQGSELPGEFLAYDPGSGSFVPRPAGLHSARVDPTRAAVFLSCQRSALGGGADSIAAWGVAQASGPPSVLPPDPSQLAPVITTSAGYMGIPPAVVAPDPPPNAIDVARTTSIVIPFDKNMNHATTQAAVSLTPSAVVTRTWDGNVLKLRPQVALSPFTDYVVRVDSTATDCVGVRDSTFSWHLLTEPLPLETADALGVARHAFGSGGTVYGVGQSFLPSATHRAYLVANESVDSLAGRTLHDLSDDGPNDFVTAANGTFGPLYLGRVTARGEYNLVVEAAPLDGVYGSGDRIDRGGIGFSVGPPVLEVPRAELPGPRVLSVGPSPARGAVTIMFAAAGARQVTVGIYDVAGRLVKRLGPGTPVQGGREVTWDARSQDGSPTGPGIYFVRVRADGANATATVVLLK